MIFSKKKLINRKKRNFQKKIKTIEIYKYIIKMLIMQQKSLPEFKKIVNTIITRLVYIIITNIR